MNRDRSSPVPLQASGKGADAGPSAVLGGAPIWMIDPVGGHRGMHYYDFALCTALAEAGVRVSLLTCDETASHCAPAGLAVRYPFERIFQDAPAPIRGLRYARALRRILALAGTERPALVHLHYFLLGPVDLWFLARLRRAGIRVVLTVHDVVPFNAARHTRALYRGLYRRVDGFVVHTEHSRRELLATFPVDPAAVHVIPHGHYLPYTAGDMPSQAEARARLGLPPEAPVLLFFGQIKRVKGLDILLRALPQVVAGCPDLLLLVAGTVWKDSWEPYAALIEQLGLAGRVRARIELIPDDEVGAYYRASDLVVLPYRRIYQSGVLLMAGSYARPVVATALGGLAETVRDGETGWLVPPEDPPALAAALSTALRDRPRLTAMGRAAQEFVTRHYGWDGIAGRTIRLYARLLAGEGGR